MTMRSFLRKIRTWLFSYKNIVRIGEPLFWLLGRRPCDRNNLSDCHRILVVRLDELGDVLLCSAFLRELRRNLPAAWITLVVKPGMRNLVEFCPYVDEVLTFDRKTVGQILRFAVNNLWRRRFDLALNPRRHLDQNNGNLLMYLSGARLRVGFGIAAFRGIGEASTQLLTIVKENDLAQHEVIHDLELLRSIGGIATDDSLEVWFSQEDTMTADQLLGSFRVTPYEPLLAIAPGAGALFRMWPLENFIELTCRIQEIGIRTVVIGGPETIPMGQKMSLVSHLVVNLTGLTTLRQTAAILSRCCLFVGNDTGPMHLASSVKIPVVVISSFHRTGSRGHVNSPHRFGPWEVPAVILQPDRPVPPCADGCIEPRAHCISQIGVDEVYTAILELLNRTSRRQTPGTPAQAAS